MRRPLSAALLALAAVAALVAAPQPAEAAETIGTVLVIPGQSTDLVPIRLRTSRGCPATANTYFARMRGAGFPPDGIIVTAPISAGLSYREGFDVYMALPMRDFADLNGVKTLSGRYDITVYCVDKFPSRDKGDFTGALEFTSPTSYRALGASMPTGAPPLPVVVGGDGAAVEQGLNPLSSPVPPPNASAQVQPGPSLVPIALVVLIAAAAAGGLLLRLRRRRP